MVPLFSIILTTYNRSQLLPRALRSVLQQSFSNFELIIVDDHSTDNTRQVVYEFTDNRMTYIQQDHNQGVSTARNTGIKQAKGEYLCFLDDDDEYLPTFLQEVSQFLKKKSQAFIGLIWTGIAKIHEEKTIQTELFNLDNKKNLLFLLEILFSGITIHHTCFERVGLFNPTLHLREDMDIVYRMLATGLDYAAIPKVLIKIHIHEQPSLSRSITLADRIANSEYLLVAHAAFLNQNLPLWLRWHTNLVSDYYRVGKKQQARKLVCLIIKKCWYYPRIWELSLRLELKSLKSNLLKT
ncbi:glycosyl transferase group 2 family protein [Candidatus Rickettsiella viridis]|uniref:Glycosyl transferase group 2 family protein n=1 Tax=Candidatus Rickettsiella viridis TaxID=676208 RepID=A0A2Z5UTV2_9COXI|nr:glycosyltransferase family 2 protein [Candidatus Rickettsiella viridis]BBB14888.1 glycosyl transferase group 2 family protein [Candidatus Rickettsiella viridis]